MHIITGGAGFIGSALLSKLNDEGITDIVVVDSLGTSEKWRNLWNKRFHDFIHKKDFLSSSILREKIDSIVHMGACSSTTELNGDYLIENNFRYSKVLAEHALKHGIRFIYASSASTYGDGSQGYNDSHEVISTLRPRNRYGFSKNLFDLWANETKALKEIVGLKFFNVYGPNEYHKGEQGSVVLKGYSAIKKTGELRLFKSHVPEYADGEQKRDFVYVKDCVEVMWWLLKERTVNGIFNVGTGKAESWNALGTALFRALGKEANINYIEMPDELRSHYQNFTQAETDKLKKFGCPVKFHSIEEGVRDYVQGYLERNLAIL